MKEGTIPLIRVGPAVAAVTVILLTKAIPLGCGDDNLTYKGKRGDDSTYPCWSGCGCGDGNFTYKGERGDDSTHLGGYGCGDGKFIYKTERGDDSTYPGAVWLRLTVRRACVFFFGTLHVAFGTATAAAVERFCLRVCFPRFSQGNTWCTGDLQLA